MADDESEKQTAMPSTEGESSNIVSEEPMIEIPLSSGSRIFKMKVSLADFCKLPIRDIRIDSDETSSRNTNIAVMPLLNSSFCTQISSTASTTSGDKGACVVKESAEGVIRMTETPLVIPRRSSLKLPTQIAINDQGKVRCDFPFDNPNLSQREKKELNYSTLFSSKHRNNKGATRILAPETESDASTSFVFGQQGDPSHISETSADEPIDMCVKDTHGDSEDRTFPTDNSLMTSCDQQGDGDTTVAENSSMVVNVSETTADGEKDVSDDYEADQSESQEVVDGEEDLFSDDINADIDLEGGSEETVTNETKSPEVVTGEEGVKDEAEIPEHVHSGSDEPVTTTTVQQKVPEVVPGEEDAKDEAEIPEHVPSEGECAKTTDDPPVPEMVTAPETKTVISKKRKQRGKNCTVRGEIGGGEHGEKKVTIVVHSDVKKILNTVKDKFYKYSKSVKNLNIKITTSPIASLEKAGDDCVTGEITRKMTVLPALTRDERKKIRIYVDENLQIERHMIDQFRDKSDSTLGKELCEY